MPADRPSPCSNPWTISRNSKLQNGTTYFCEGYLSWGAIHTDLLYILAADGVCLKQRDKIWAINKLVYIYKIHRLHSILLMIIFAFISKGLILLNKGISPPFVCSYFSANAEPGIFCYCRYSAPGLTMEDASKAFQIGASLQQSEFVVTWMLQHFPAFEYNYVFVTGVF
jgi:hypothetical protein